MEARSTRSGGTLPTGLLAIFSSAYLPAASLILPLGVYLPNYYASHLGVSLAAVGAAFSIVRLIDIFLDPVIGVAINGTRTSFGRFKPWLFAGIPLLMVAGYLVFMAKPGITSAYMVGSLLLLYAGFSVVTVGQSSWAAALVPDYHQRSRIYGWAYAIGVVGSVIVLLLPILLAKVWHQSQAVGVQAMGWFVIGAAPLCILLTLTIVREPVIKETADTITLRDYGRMLARPSLLRLLAADLTLALGPAITAALYLFFFVQALGYSLPQVNILLLCYMAAGFVGAPFWWRISKQIGKHRTVILACVLYGLAQALVFFLPHRMMVLMVPAMFLAGFVVSAFTFLIRSMIADIGDEVRLDSGKDRTPLLYGLVTSTSKVGSSLAVVVTYSLLAVFHFNPKEGVVNTGAAMNALIACYVIVPVLTMFVGAICLRGYHLDVVRHGAIRAELDARDEAMGSADAEAENLAGVVPLIQPGE
jgi:Na+/melibiose symporter-like transporter